MKLLTTFWLPKPTPIATAPPRKVNMVSGTLAKQRADQPKATTNR